MCAACLAAGRSEASHLARIARTGDRGQPGRRLLLCAGHLSDRIVLAGQREAGSLLAWQAGSLAAALTRPSPRRRSGGWFWPRRRKPPGPGACPVCLASEAAARQAASGKRGTPATRPAQPHRARG